MNHKPLFLATALIVLLAIAGVFWYMQTQSVAMDQSVVVSNPVTKPDSVSVVPPSAHSDSYPQHIEAIPGNTDEVWYNIPELGIRMKLNKGFAEDLVYQYYIERNVDNDTVAGFYLGSKALGAIDEGCRFGWTVSKGEGEINPYDEYLTSRVSINEAVQFPGFFLVLGGPQDVCWREENDSIAKNVINKSFMGKGAKSVIEGFRTIELIPQK